ncbi:tungstate ABC transporter binding protein WtpA [Sporomusaceae bacterium BoRhaA]|uniref:substrate-binding domain-containing protein n=1 Tax=Pelorhabdus rhamnosifermentans TaxID=2772457 RepID=UPI001C061314|nr:substrate-binding domain-containing protein [Pelorhabdus rhamnosifermentans]MBU2703481.1 tungstate ABC transporter binding protein WtpA [Pelorhabdus rhamnosifermentans]
MKKRVLSLFLILSLILLAGCGVNQQKAQDQKVTLTVLGAGSLTGPFKQVNDAFQKKYPNVTVQDQYGGSVKVVKQVTELNQPADLVAVADYTVIPKLMFGNDGKKAYTNWYIGFVSNEMTFAYTDKSKGADKINEANWYKVLAENGMQIGRSNPDTDPSGYKFIRLKGV